MRLLGPVQLVTADGATLDLPSMTQRHVLAALALEPGVTVRAELLCERLGLSPGALRTTVSRLRGRVGAQVIATDALGYRLTCRTDAAAFESLLLDRDRDADRVEVLRDALGLWSGPALDEFRHEPWCEAELFRLDELHDLAVEELAAALIEAGRGGEAVATLQAHVVGQPLRDGARGLLMRALASVGRQAEALRAFQDYRRFLAEETGTEPSAEVADIEQRIAAGWDGRSPADAIGIGDGADRRSPGGTHVLPPMLARQPDGRRVGRDAEIEVLDTELRAVLAGRGARAALISGEAGIGKTTLAAAFARRVHDAGGTTILYGRCADGATDPLQPFRSVITSLVATVPTELLAAHARRCGGDIQRIAPGIARRTWVPPLGTADEATDRHQLFEAVADLLSRAADARPLLVVIDDLHWAQPTALELLGHLAAELGDARILLIATVRDEAIGRSVEVRRVVADLERAGARRVALRGFSDEELGQLVANLVGSSARAAPEVVEALRDQTAGNPLYAAQLARHLADAGRVVADDGSVRLTGAVDDDLPASLTDLVWARVGALGGSAASMLRAASVLGGSFDPNMLVALTQASDDEAAAALRAARQAGLIEEEPAHDLFRFVHGLVVRALYDELDPLERRQVHRAAADLLEHRAPDRPLAVVAQMARHRALAGDRSEACRWAELAGDRAMAQLAWTEAAQWYDRALADVRALDRGDAEVAALLVKVAAAHRRSGDLDQAVASVQTAAVLAQRAGAHEVLVEAALAGDRGHVSATTLDQDQLDLVETALGLVDPDDLARRARLLAQHAQELVHTDRFEDRERSGRLAIDLAERSGDPALLGQLVSAISFGLWGLGSLELRADLADRAERSARRSVDPRVRFASSRATYIVAVESGDADRAREALARMRAIAVRCRDPQLAWTVGCHEVFEATMAGALDDAEALLDANLERGLAIAEPDALPVYGGQLFVLRSFAFRYEELVPLLDDLAAANAGVTAFSLARAIACAASGRREVARAVLDAGIDAGFPTSRDHYWLTTVVGYAVLAVELGDERAAALLYPRLEPYAAQATFTGATSQGPVAAYLGKLASMLGRHEEADAHLRAALDVAERCTWRYHRATTLVALAQSHHRATGALDDQARRWLDEACAIAASCGLDGVRAQASALAATAT